MVLAAGEQSHRGFSGGLELHHLAPANERVSCAKTPACCYKSPTAPGPKYRAAVSMFCVIRKAVDELREVVQVMCSAGCIRAQRYGAKYACK